jgi:DinB superfamily
MPMSDDERRDILERTRASWQALSDAVGTLSDDELSRPNTVGTWSGRDLMVHVACWDEELTRMLGDLDRGQPLNWPDTQRDNINAWNAERVAPFHNRAIAETKRYFTGAHDAFMSALTTSPSVSVALVGRYHAHYDEHRAHFEALRWRGR